MRLKVPLAGPNECGAATLRLSLLLLLGICSVPLNANLSPLASYPEPLKRLLENPRYGSVTLDEAKKVSSHLNLLTSSLADERVRPYWSKMVVVIGLIGDTKAVPHLTEFMQSGSGLQNTDSYSAKTNVLTALGYILAQTPPSVTLVPAGDTRQLTCEQVDAKNPNACEAFRFLTNGLTGSNWGRIIRWDSPTYTNKSDFHRYLVKRSFYALGLSGREEALQQMKNHPCLEKPECPYRNAQEIAVKANLEVRRNGLAAYLTQP